MAIAIAAQRHVAAHDVRGNARAGKDGTAARPHMGVRRARVCRSAISPRTSPSIRRSRRLVWASQPSPGERAGCNMPTVMSITWIGPAARWAEARTPPANTVYVRRWSVEPLPTNPNNTLILQVLVFSVGDRPETGTRRRARSRAGRSAPGQCQDKKITVMSAAFDSKRTRASPSSRCSCR